jgi:hypothetical protein
VEVIGVPRTMGTTAALPHAVTGQLRNTAGRCGSTDTNGAVLERGVFIATSAVFR